MIVGNSLEKIYWKGMLVFGGNGVGDENVEIPPYEIVEPTEPPTTEEPSEEPTNPPTTEEPSEEPTVTEYTPTYMKVTYELEGNSSIQNLIGAPYYAGFEIFDKTGSLTNTYNEKLEDIPTTAGYESASYNWKFDEVYNILQTIYSGNSYKLKFCLPIQFNERDYDGSYHSVGTNAYFDIDKTKLFIDNKFCIEIKLKGKLTTTVEINQTTTTPTYTVLEYIYEQ